VRVTDPVVPVTVTGALVEAEDSPPPGANWSVMAYTYVPAGSVPPLADGVALSSAGGSTVPGFPGTRFARPECSPVTSAPESTAPSVTDGSEVTVSPNVPCAQARFWLISDWM
jgi:hypothetical protein